MQAYLNNQLIKDTILMQLKAHYDADEIIKGTYWKNGKGCAVGCILHEPNGKHYLFEERCQIPQIIARLIDRIFEGLSNENAKKWPLKIMQAIPVGGDLTSVWPKFAYWLLMDEKNGVIQYAKSEQAKVAINNVGNLYNDLINGAEVTQTQWKDAADAAADAYAAAYAAYAAAAAAYAAAAAAYAAAAAAAAAAYAAAAAAAAAAYAAAATAAAYADAKKNAYKKMAAKLIELVKETKIYAK